MVGDGDVWHEIDYETAWAPFNRRFRFTANFYERDEPAVQLEQGCLVVDLANSIAAVPVFPNGDYYAHMTQDLRWDTFGHPWQQTLTIWGEELVESLGSELLTLLPRHPQSRG